jgi:cytochrome c oxidase assembly protein subunit 11
MNGPKLSHNPNADGKNLNSVLLKKHVRLVGLLITLVIGMFGFGFALVPIYNSLCKALSINGKVDLKPAVYDANKLAHDKRLVEVQFVATKSAGVPWEFYPKTRKIKIHPGDINRLEFYAENKTNKRMTVQAIPSVTPGLAAKYIKKTECFCFTQQTLGGHEAMNMPLLFHLDPDLPKNITTITLAYTMFDISKRVH